METRKLVGNVFRLEQSPYRSTPSLESMQDDIGLFHTSRGFICQQEKPHVKRNQEVDYRNANTSDTNTTEVVGVQPG